MTQEEMYAALDEIYDVCAAQVTGNPGRLAQLRSALDTAQMAVDFLFTEVPYNLTNP